MTSIKQNSLPITVAITAGCPSLEELKKSLFPAPVGRNEGTTQTVYFIVRPLNVSERRAYPGMPELDEKTEVTLRASVRLMENRDGHTWTICGVVEIVQGSRLGGGGLDDPDSLYGLLGRRQKAEGCRWFHFSALCAPSNNNGKFGFMHIGVTPMEHCEH